VAVGKESPSSRPCWVLLPSIPALGPESRSMGYWGKWQGHGVRGNLTEVSPDVQAQDESCSRSKRRQGTVHSPLPPPSPPPQCRAGRETGGGACVIWEKARQAKGASARRQGRMLFEVTLLTENANHKRYRVSLRSSSKRVPSNPSPNGVVVWGVSSRQACQG
jgi:hypothetical protein